MRNPVVTIAFDATPVHAAAALTSVLPRMTESDEVARGRAEWLLAAAIPLYVHLKKEAPDTYAAVDFLEFIRFENLTSLTEDDVALPDDLHQALIDYFEILSGQIAWRSGVRSSAAGTAHADALILIRRIFNVADFRIS